MITTQFYNGDRHSTRYINNVECVFVEKRYIEETGAYYYCVVAETANHKYMLAKYEANNSFDEENNGEEEANALVEHIARTNGDKSGMIIIE